MLGVCIYDYATLSPNKPNDKFATIGTGENRKLETHYKRFDWPQVNHLSKELNVFIFSML